MSELKVKTATIKYQSVGLTMIYYVPKQRQSLRANNGRQHLGVPRCDLEPTNQSETSIVSRVGMSSNGRRGAKYDNGSLDRTYVSRIGATVLVCIYVRC